MQCEASMAAAIVELDALTDAVRSATEDHDLKFHQVHAKDNGRIRYKRVCEECGEVVEYADINRAFQADDGRSVVITDDSDHAECPLCGTVADTFLPFGIKSVRPDRQCPACGSLERHRLMWLFFALRTDLFTRPQQVLHFAPEGTISVRLGALPTIDYLTADLDPTQAMVQMDITDIDRPDASFDVIFASHVLEHVPDDVRAMRELRRILRPDGWAVLEVPIPLLLVSFTIARFIAAGNLWTALFLAIGVLLVAMLMLISLLLLAAFQLSPDKSD